MTVTYFQNHTKYSVSRQNAPFWIVIVCTRNHHCAFTIQREASTLYNLKVHAITYPSKEQHRFVNFCTYGSSNTQWI